MKVLDKTNILSIFFYYERDTGILFYNTDQHKTGKKSFIYVISIKFL